MIKINLGCGRNLVPGFVNIDGFLVRDELGKMPRGAQFIQARAEDIPYNDNTVDYLESVDMIEHIPLRNVQQVFSEVYRVLKPGKMFRLSTPNLENVLSEFLNVNNRLTQRLQSGENYTDLFDETYAGDSWPEVAKKDFNRSIMVIFGNQFHAGELHMNGFTPANIYIHLLKAGFKKENIKITVHEKDSIAPTLPGNKHQMERGKKYRLINETMLIEAIK